MRQIVFLPALHRWEYHSSVLSTHCTGSCCWSRVEIRSVCIQSWSLSLLGTHIIPCKVIVLVSSLDSSEAEPFELSPAETNQLCRPRESWSWHLKKEAVWFGLGWCQFLHLLQPPTLFTTHFPVLCSDFQVRRNTGRQGSNNEGRLFFPCSK